MKLGDDLRGPITGTRPQWALDIKIREFVTTPMVESLKIILTSLLSSNNILFSAQWDALRNEQDKIRKTFNMESAR